jgi:Lon protease-like protein
VAEEPIEMPIFELPLAALPSEQVPLHVFEERYKLMMADCIEDGSSFGIVLRTDAGAHSVGCAAEVSRVLERFDDGRLNLLATGTFSFRVLDRYEGADYPMALVERLPDPEPVGGPEMAAVRKAFQELLDAVDSDAEGAAKGDSAFEIAARVELDVEAKQQLLEATSEPERLTLLREALAALARQVKSSRELAERARGNGHAPIQGMSPPETPESDS